MTLQLRRSRTRSRRSDEAPGNTCGSAADARPERGAVAGCRRSPGQSRSDRCASSNCSAYRPTSQRMAPQPWLCGERPVMPSYCSICICRVLDGFGLAQAIRREEAKQGLPRSGLIAVTADALKGEDARCFAAGMDGFLTKPISLDALARTLGRWIPALVPAARPARTASARCSTPRRCAACSVPIPERLAALVQSFADSAARDIAAHARGAGCSTAWRPRHTG